VEDSEILKDLTLDIERDTLTVIMGKNGAGKSSLAKVIMGHPAFKILSGNIFVEGEEITDFSPDKIAKKGVFLGFQHPVAVPGVTVIKFLQASYRALYGEIKDYDDFQENLLAQMGNLGIDSSFLYRYLNDGFSGGEKKRLEMLQLLVLKPKIAILDEPDSGLDVDALKAVGNAIQLARNIGITVVLITHYQRLLDYVKTDRVVVLGDGEIILSGGFEIVREIEANGYMSFSHGNGGKKKGRSCYE
jgi:Fe-S cluster assembly ATP-binding protein